VKTVFKRNICNLLSPLVVK